MDSSGFLWGRKVPKSFRRDSQGFLMITKDFQKEPEASLKSHSGIPRGHEGVVVAGTSTKEYIVCTK
eukprot:5712155-Pyramimonas_sp.AAC.1